MTNWFITAAGSADRCNGECKHMYIVGGESIIKRTIRLIHEVDPEAEVSIITWRKELMNLDGTIFIDTITPTSSLADTILYSMEFWGDRNIILMGDVVFTWDAIRQLYLYTGSPMVFGRLYSKGNKLPERFALSFRREDSEDIRCGLKRCSNHAYGDRLNCPLMNGFPEVISRVYPNHPRGIKGWIFYHICTPYIRYLAKSTPFTEIKDGRVEDIDVKEDLLLIRGLWNDQSND